MPLREKARERAMALSPQVIMVIVLVLVILCLPVPPSWSLALIIAFVAVVYAIKTFVAVVCEIKTFVAVIYARKTRNHQILPVFFRSSAAARFIGGWTSAVHPPVGAPPSADVAAGNPESSSTSLSPFGIEYEVFLTFRKQDTRSGFADFLFLALKNAGIRVFRDYEELRSGEELTPGLIGAIKQSRISIAFLSKDFASCTWCIKQLVQMWESRKLFGQTIIPIFYDVSPLDVKHLAGDFGKSFNRHLDRFHPDTIQTWREVLQRIGRLKGYSREGHDGRLVKEVLAHVVQVLKNDGVVVTDKLVGIDHRAQEIMDKLGVAYSKGQATKVRGEEVRVVRIWGMPGVGKTTLAKVVFNKIRKLFDACSFCEDITSEGVEFSRYRLIADLQKQKPAPLESSSEGIEEMASLCRNAKVLVVLDSVDKYEQIEELVGKLTWFDPRSRIIVTTNKREVLNAFDVGAIEEYEVTPMSNGHALELFRRHAFQWYTPEGASEYDSLSVDIAKAIGGLPSDIVRYASSLCSNMNIDLWRTTLGLLQKHSKNRQAASQVSYAGGSELEDSIEDNQLAGPIQDSSINQSPSVSKASKLRRCRTI